MKNTHSETEMKTKSKKTGLIVAGVILGVIAVAALLIFLVIPGILYGSADKAISNGDYIKAYESLTAIGSFKDSEERAASIYHKYLVQMLKTAQAGDSFTFGTYEQDGHNANGAEDIQWLVLAIEDNKALVLSKYALDCVAYNSEFASSSWETCTLRPWLNDTFYSSAFSANDQSIIATTTVSADKNPMFGTDPGQDTQDPMFLLSVSETEAYCTDRALMQCEPTEYALRKNIDYDMESGYCKWWLRSPGLNPSDATAVGAPGYVYGQGNYVFFKFYGVRPAMWIDLSE